MSIHSVKPRRALAAAAVGTALIAPLACSSPAPDSAPPPRPPSGNEQPAPPLGPPALPTWDPGGPPPVIVLNPPAVPAAPTVPPPVVVAPKLPVSANPFVNQIAKGSVEGANEWGVPASVSIAQAILESASGTSELAKNAHNLFGIKGTGPAGSYAKSSPEFVNGKWIMQVSKFRKYSNDAESIADHARHIATSGHYGKAMSHKDDAVAFTRALQGIYATDPNYASKVLSIMEREDLAVFDTYARKVA